jgi:hypothetical protein
MKPKLIFQNECLLIPNLASSEDHFFVIKLIGFLSMMVIPVCLGMYLFVHHFVISISIFIISIPCAYFIYSYWFKREPIAQLTIRKVTNYIQLNQKKILFDDLLFLSIRESENYRIIRLEAKRKNIVFANEVIITSNCDSLDEAVSLCRQIRDFIDVNLKINMVEMAVNRAGRKDAKNEIWHYVE